MNSPDDETGGTVGAWPIGARVRILGGHTFAGSTGVVVGWVGTPGGREVEVRIWGRLVRLEVPFHQLAADDGG